jgi:hypothetical protein
MVSFWRGLKQLVTKVDRFGGPFELCLNGESTFKSLPGAVLTLMWTGLLIWYTYMTILSILDRTSPSVAYVSVQSKESAEIVSNDLLPIMLIVNRTGQTVVPNQLHKRFATFVAYSETNELNIDIKKRIITRTYYPVKPCSEIQNTKHYQSLFKDERVKLLVPLMFQCIDVPENESIELVGNLIANTMKSFKVVAYPCSLPNSSDCLPQSEFDSFSISIMYQKYALQMSNFEQPFDSIWTPREEQNMLMNIGTSILNYVSNYKIFDQVNSLTSKTLRKTKATVEKEQLNVVPRKPHATCTSAEVEDGSCSPYFLFEYRSSGIVYEYTRTYIDFLVGFSNIGGFKELLTVVCIFLYSFWNNTAKEIFIRRKVIDYDSLKMLLENQFLKINAKKEPSRKETIKDPYIGNSEELKLAVNPSSHIDIGAESSPTKIVPVKGSSGNLPLQIKDEGSGRSNSVPKISNIMEFRIERKFSKFSLDTMKKMREFGMAVQNTIDHHTNIVTLVQELSTLRVLALIIMTPYQRKLLPLVAMQMNKNDAEDSVKGDSIYFKSKVENDRKPSVSSMTDRKKNDPISKVAEYVKVSISYEEALQALVNGSNGAHIWNEYKKESHQSELSEIRSEINKFMLYHLPDWVKEYLPPKNTTTEIDEQKSAPVDNFPTQVLPLSNTQLEAKGKSHTLGNQNFLHNKQNIAPRRSIHRLNSSIKTQNLPSVLQ